MSRRSWADLRYRLSGVLLILASGLLALAHKQIVDTRGNAEPALIEFAMALGGFSLASLGALMLIHGRKLRRPRRTFPRNYNASGRPCCSKAYAARTILDG